jgi:hypothetical protein
MALIHSTGSIKSGLVMCVDAANTKSYPGSGTTWTNIVDTTVATVGTLVNTPTYTSTRPSYFTFTAASSQRVTFPSSSTFQFLSTASYTLEAWVYPTAATNLATYYIIDRASAGSDGYTLRMVGNGTNISFAVLRLVGGATEANVSTAFVYAINTWYHVVYTYNSASVALYVNGTSTGTGTSTSGGSITDTAKVVEIGARNSANFLSGRIGTARIYNVALTAAQVYQNFNAFDTRFGLPG